ncbi:solute carrier family 40 member 1 [Hyalella azteca]|uniref:Solute carrier family 40 member n=1 Tax=Hyalella azteca TaxID=294128 RepID=A0A8B7NR57_HYAAZ|nr:solute carrier family 40 member 1 [Hyalella azteca]
MENEFLPVKEEASSLPLILMNDRDEPNVMALSNDLQSDISEFPSSSNVKEREPAKDGCCSPCLPNKWSPLTLIYVLSFLGHWGDRKWMFTAGMILVQISPSSMRLIGLYYATTCVFVIVFAAPLGSWIDRNPRRQVALTCLLVQNLCVALSGACFLVILQGAHFMQVLVWLEPLLLCGAVCAAAVAAVASSGCQTCLTKDWLVEVASRNPHLLARSNSVIRAIDLGTEVMSPVAAGYLMAAVSVSVGAVVIIVWNLSSLLLEAALYARIWKLCPRLQISKPEVTCTTSSECSAFARLRHKVEAMSFSWRVYLTHQVRCAGLGLALLYMTVLSLDNYSRAYLFEAGLNELILGVCTALSSLPGLLGSLLFPFLRRKMGLERTGLLGFGWLSGWLLLCVASVFAPGSLFYLAPWQQRGSLALGVSLMNYTTPTTTSASLAVAVATNLTAGLRTHDDSIGSRSSNLTAGGRGVTDSYCSMVMLLTGIIVSRFGLWTADLSVVQSMQELVAPHERGAISGVQESLNQFFSLLRSLLLIAFPRMDTFGYMIMLSFVFVFTGFLSYCKFYAQRKKINTPVTGKENQGDMDSVKVE